MTATSSEASEDTDDCGQPILPTDSIPNSTACVSQDDDTGAGDDFDKLSLAKQSGKEPSNAAKEAERVRQDKRQFVKAASTFQIRDWSAKTKPIHLYRRLADEHMGVDTSRSKRWFSDLTNHELDQLAVLVTRSSAYKIDAKYTARRALRDLVAELWNVSQESLTEDDAWKCVKNDDQRHSHFLFNRTHASQLLMRLTSNSVLTPMGEHPKHLPTTSHNLQGTSTAHRLRISGSPLLQDAMTTSAQHARASPPVTSSGMLTGLEGHQGHLTFSMTAAQHVYGAPPGTYAAAAYMQSSVGHPLAAAGMAQPPPGPHAAGFPWYAAPVQAGEVPPPPFMAPPGERAPWSTGDLAATASSTPTPPAAPEFYHKLLHKDPASFMFNGASAYAAAMHKAHSWNSQGAFMHEPPPMVPGSFSPADLMAYQHYQSQLLQSVSGLPSLSAALQEPSPNMQQQANPPVGGRNFSSNTSTVPPPPVGNPPINAFLASKSSGSSVVICDCGCGLPVAAAESQQALASFYLQQAHSTTNSDYRHLMRHAPQHSHHPSQVAQSNPSVPTAASGQQRGEFREPTQRRPAQLPLASSSHPNTMSRAIVLRREPQSTHPKPAEVAEQKSKAAAKQQRAAKRQRQSTTQSDCTKARGAHPHAREHAHAHRQRASSSKMATAVPHARQEHQDKRIKTGETGGGEDRNSNSPQGSSGSGSMDQAASDGQNSNASKGGDTGVKEAARAVSSNNEARAPTAGTAMHPPNGGSVDALGSGSGSGSACNVAKQAGGGAPKTTGSDDGGRTGSGGSGGSGTGQPKEQESGSNPAGPRCKNRVESEPVRTSPHTGPGDELLAGAVECLSKLGGRKPSAAQSPQACGQSQKRRRPDQEPTAFNMQPTLENLQQQQLWLGKRKRTQRAVERVQESSDGNGSNGSDGGSNKCDASNGSNGSRDGSNNGSEQGNGNSGQDTEGNGEVKAPMEGFPDGELAPESCYREVDEGDDGSNTSGGNAGHPQSGGSGTTNTPHDAQAAGGEQAHGQGQEETTKESPKESAQTLKKKKRKKKKAAADSAASMLKSACDELISLANDLDKKVSKAFREDSKCLWHIWRTRIQGMQDSKQLAECVMFLESQLSPEVQAKGWQSQLFSQAHDAWIDPSKANQLVSLLCDQSKSGARLKPSAR